MRLASGVGWTLAAGLLVLSAGGAARGDDFSRRFETEIAPLLVERCVECHGPQAKKGRLDLSRREAALAGGESGPAITPGKSDESLLWHYVEADDMPKDRQPLSDAEKRLLREWIDAGAPWPRETIFADPIPASETWVRRLTVPEYIETVRSTLGVDIEQDARQLLPPDVRADGFSNTAYNLQIDLRHVEAYAELARIIVERMDVVAYAAQFNNKRLLDGDAMRELISGMGEQLFRGPLDKREVASFLQIPQAVAEAGGDYREAVGYVLEAMLQSPRFLYRMEAPQGGPGSPLGGYQLASRLSYILWGGPPDAELLRAARAGELSDHRRLEEQVQRMLRDPRAIEMSLRFVEEWLNLNRLRHLRPNPERFPKWSEALAVDMREETRAYFRHVVWDEQRPLADLMNAEVTFVTPRLAEFYGLPRNALAKKTSEETSREPKERKQGPQRVTAGLQALYTFQEGGGATVRDLAGAREPMDLRIANPNAVQWGSDGLTVRRPTLIVAVAPARRLTQAIKNSKAVTLEAWVTPANASQAGPARIATLSANPSARNFTLGQEGDKYDVRFRTARTDGNGLPSLASPGKTVQTKPTHIVYTRDPSGKAKLYINGQEKASRNTPGDLSNWDARLQFALANELTRDRPWLGTLHLVAVYDRPLAADEVRRNHAAGSRPDVPAAPPLAAHRGERLKDVQALYTFQEGSGDVVRDVSGAGERLDLKIENASAVAWEQGGLRLKAPTLIASAQPPRRLINAIKKSNAVSLEVWVTPENASQAGPARILTLSSGTGARNFTLGQDGDRFDVRLRATRTDGNGLPSVSSRRGSVALRPTHIVYTRDATGRAKLYVDGEQQGAGNIDGALSNWDGGFRLALGNETSKDRPWRGVLHLAAVYSRALSAEEVRSRSRAPSQQSGPPRYDLASVPSRGGLLTQGSVLTVGGDEASMVGRGLFVFRHLLNGRVEDPPPCVDTTPVPTRPGQSQRAIAEGRVNNQACSGCHGMFEPLVFGLEKFDGLGAFHEVDHHGNRLREDGWVHFPGQDEPIPYKTTGELMNLLAGSERVQHTITRKVAQFTLGRPLTEADEPILEQVHQQAQENGGTYASLIAAIVLSDWVRK